MGTKDFHPQDFVFIAYHDEAMKEEAGRSYPVTEDDYYESMGWAGNFMAWECALRSEVATRDEKQEEPVTNEDKILKALAEEMPEIEVPEEVFNRVWGNLRKNLEGTI